jgi:hypothetical protein
MHRLMGGRHWLGRSGPRTGSGPRTTTVSWWAVGPRQSHLGACHNNVGVTLPRLGQHKEAPEHIMAAARAVAALKQAFNVP